MSKRERTEDIKRRLIHPEKITAWKKQCAERREARRIERKRAAALRPKSDKWLNKGVLGV